MNKYFTMSDFEKESFEFQVFDFMSNHSVEDFTIHSDCSVSVEGNVEIEPEDLIEGELPFKFYKVTGDFICRDLGLRTLEGCPEVVTGNFDCSENDLTTLEGGPREVGGIFNCMNNNLISLKDIPKKVGRSIWFDF